MELSGKLQAPAACYRDRSASLDAVERSTSENQLQTEGKSILGAAAVCAEGFHCLVMLRQRQRQRQIGSTRGRTDRKRSTGDVQQQESQSHNVVMVTVPLGRDARSTPQQPCVAMVYTRHVGPHLRRTRRGSADLPNEHSVDDPVTALTEAATAPRFLSAVGSRLLLRRCAHHGSQLTPTKTYKLRGL